MGEARLRQELAAKGIEKQIIEEAIKRNIGAEEELKMALELAQERLQRHYQSQDWLAIKRKLFAFLHRRGFAYGIITEVVRRLGQKTGQSLDL